MKVLVTGGAVIEHSLRAGHTVAVLDDLSTACRGLMASMALASHLA